MGTIAPARFAQARRIADADNVVPLAHAQHFVPLLRQGTLHLRDRESHLGGLGIAEEVIDTILHW